jgi:hypothetical protein
LAIGISYTPYMYLTHRSGKSNFYFLSTVLQSELSGYNNNHISDPITMHNPLYHHSALEPTYCIVACTLVQVAYAHLISSNAGGSLTANIKIPLRNSLQNEVLYNILTLQQYPHPLPVHVTPHPPTPSQPHAWPRSTKSRISIPLADFPLTQTPYLIMTRLASPIFSLSGKKDGPLRPWLSRPSWQSCSAPRTSVRRLSKNQGFLP